MSTFEVDASDLDLSSLVANRLQRLDPLYKAWANHMEGLTVRSFKEERAPYGQPWRSLTPRYEQYKRTYGSRKKRGADRRGKPKAGGAKKLQWTGQLYDRIYARVEKDGVVAGAGYRVGAYDLGAIHQYGAPRANIPPRPFLPIDSSGEPFPQLVNDLRQMAEDYLNS